MAETRTRRQSHQGYPKRGEIYLTALGHEINKTRPALIIQNGITNRYGLTTIVAAITSRVSVPPYPNEAIIRPGASGLHNDSTVRLDQIRTVDRQRLLKRLGQVDSFTLREVDRAIKASLGLINT